MLLVKNIAKIVGVDESGRLRVKGRDMNVLGEIDNAWLLADGDRIAAYGTMDKMPEITPDTEVVDAEGGMLFPSFCDSHTHLVYAGSREQEFLDKINGLSYEEIAKRGGGILNSADRLHETSEDELYEQAMERIREIIAMGTGCVEIKSGYGLTTEDELKMLRVIRRIRETSPITVRATFLGAHAVGRAYKGRQQEYVDLICREMIPAVGREKLAEFVDVFCDQGFFTVEETEQILRAGAEYGLVPKIHANELAVFGRCAGRCPQQGAVRRSPGAHGGRGDRSAAHVRYDADDAAGCRFLPGDAVSSCTGNDRGRFERGSGFGFQPRLVAFGQYEDDRFAGLHQDAYDAGRSDQRRDTERCLRHGLEQRVRFDHRRQEGELLPHDEDSFGGISAVCLYLSAYPPGIPPGARGEVIGRYIVRSRGRVFCSGFLFFLRSFLADIGRISGCMEEVVILRMDEYVFGQFRCIFCRKEKYDTLFVDCDRAYEHGNNFKCTEYETIDSRRRAGDRSKRNRSSLFR